MKKLLTIFLMISYYTVFAQSDDSLFSRLSGIAANGSEFYNIDGIEISSRTVTGEFSVKNIVKNFKGYSIKEKELVAGDSVLGVRNFYIDRSEKQGEVLVQNASVYVIENAEKGITVVTFNAINKSDRDFERRFVKLINSKMIPSDIYAPMKIDSINFAGRKIALGGSCGWQGVNNVQCPYYGQMNWSVHRDLQDAIRTATNHSNANKGRNGIKVISEDSVAVLFEGVDIKVSKVVYDLKGVKSLLAGMSGGKTLTVYYVAAPVRNNFVSCVMSYWNNDNINPSGLPPLLEQVMKLK
ncbi:MAG: hypothetical protein QM731_14745 [Chitinophagaceae bacterium]